jgi:uroporphyrinogen-III decarboxylase
MDRLFPADRMTKRERVEAALKHHPVDRVPILEQLSYNARVLSDWTGRAIRNFDYTIDDICQVIRKTCDLAMPPAAPSGTERVTAEDGFVTQNDNWTRWIVSRPFVDEHGACEWLRRKTKAIIGTSLDDQGAGAAYKDYMCDIQQRIGETVILNYSFTGFCGVFDAMGLEIFTFFMEEYADVMAEHIEASTAREVERVHAVADPSLSPVILIAEDFATKQGPIFSPAFLQTYHFPFVRRVVNAWHEHGIGVIYHSDGNYRKCIPDLMACGVDGFYCLEPNCGMDAVELKRSWPEMVWSGGIDGVDLMERGTPEQVRAEVRRHILDTDALTTGGMIIASSSEINPPIPPENFRAMVGGVGEIIRNNE